VGSRGLGRESFLDIVSGIERVEGVRGLEGGTDGLFAFGKEKRMLLKR